MKSQVELLRFPDANPALGYDLNMSTGIEYADGSGSFIVRCTYDVTVKECSEGDDEEQFDVASIVCEHAGLFVLDEELDSAELERKELEAFALTTGLFALHPFARQYINDVTSRLAIPPLTIDVMVIPHNAERVDVP